jgi:glucokinase
MTGSTRLVADIGGTNSRLALFDTAQVQLQGLHVVDNAAFPALEAVLENYLAALATPPTTACLAVAAPVKEGEVRMANRPWRFFPEQLRERFGFRQLVVINDFAAIAHALPYLDDADLAVVHSGGPHAVGAGRLAAVGPGTGLGGATLDRGEGQPRVYPAEPGQAGLAVATDEEVALLQWLRRHHGDTHNELLVSGPGLERIYRGLCELAGYPPGTGSAAAITDRALAQEEALAVRALRIFCALLGSVCGDFLLHNGAYGGLYLAGGIVPRILPFLGASDFHRRLCDKGVMRAQLAQVPVYAITGGQPGLLGAGRMPLNPPQS